MTGARVAWAGVYRVKYVKKHWVLEMDKSELCSVCSLDFSASSFAWFVFSLLVSSLLFPQSL
jgi:hypothetical protein